MAAETGFQTFTPIAFEPSFDAAGVRREIRAFLAEHQAPAASVARANAWMSADPAFSRALGAAGYIGMIWPKQYGGGERQPLERYIVLEELLAAGAPVGLHWIADRQSGPLLLRYGTEEQRRRFLPGVAQGEQYFCIGMSEPSAGSDLASVRTRATPMAGGWMLNGQKIWTTHAHRCSIMMALVRSVPGSARQEGLTQLLIDLSTPGVRVRPIIDLAGNHDFNEVYFDDVFVPHSMLVGTEGEGWNQVTAELSLERSGPERYLSSLALLLAFVARVGADPDPISAALIGKLTAELWTLRQMSMSTAAKLASGKDPALEAAIVKDLGNTFEQEMPRAIRAASPGDLDLAAETDFTRVLFYLLQVSPSFSLRGGTREVLRGIIAKGLGLR
jgi:alkylation response protein AidB-like acyl-CoA dehydrogenase